MSGAVACARDPAPEQRAESAPSGSKIFVLNGHGAPTHNIALSEAADFVSETFRVTMLHVTALLPDKALAGEAVGHGLAEVAGATAATLAIRRDGSIASPTPRRVQPS